ncbi:MAG: TRAP transporter large permease subunit [Dehalococcoidales bacterium]
MIDINPEAITVIMLGGILVGVLTGYYIAAVIGAVAILVGFVAAGPEITGNIIYLRMYDFSQKYSFLALPLFIFMGLWLEKAGTVEDMYKAMYLWLGGYRGGLAVCTVLVGTILAACVGVIAASTTMLALVALPSMIKRGYDKSLASGTTAVSGTLGILIPPSIMLVVFGPLANLSVGKLFFGAFIPGFLLSGLYISYITIRSFLQPELAPVVPAEERAIPFGQKVKTLFVSLVPPSFIILSVLGVIFFGIAPPTEAAACGAFASMLLVIARRNFSFRLLKETCLETIKLFAYVFFIAGISFAFVGVFLHLGGGKVIQEMLMAAPGGSWGAFAVVMLIVFVLGFFVEWLGILAIMAPIVFPIVPALGFDPIWFAIMIAINLQMGFNTPPFAPAIYFTVGAAAPELKITMTDVIRGVIPFIPLIMLGLGLCSFFPQLVLWLPSMMIK